MRAERIGDGPILAVDPAHPGIGDNVNGPSLVRAPAWLPDPLGRYYLYFAHHRGAFIRLATADRLEGPWRARDGGVLPVAQSTCLDHVASPDVHVDDERRQIRLYFHGVVHHPEGVPDPHANPMDATRPFVQRSKLAVSRDGLSFAVRDEVLGPSYFRVFRHGGFHYAFAMPGIVYRSRDGVSGFERGPQLFGDEQRHLAVRVRGDRLDVFYTNAGDRPERILHCTIDLEDDWHAWRPTAPRELLRPERPWEGAARPLVASQRGLAPGPVHQLRDPAVFEESGRSHLVYAVAGEQGLALARLVEDEA